MVFVSTHTLQEGAAGQQHGLKKNLLPANYTSLGDCNLSTLNASFLLLSFLNLLMMLFWWLGNLFHGAWHCGIVLLCGENGWSSHCLGGPAWSYHAVLAETHVHSNQELSCFWRWTGPQWGKQKCNWHRIMCKDLASWQLVFFLRCWSLQLFLIALFTVLRMT